jgi:hypothetical protein
MNDIAGRILNKCLGKNIVVDKKSKNMYALSKTGKCERCGEENVGLYAKGGHRVCSECGMKK